MDWPQLIPVLLALALIVPLPSFADKSPAPTERTHEAVPPPGVFPSDVEARGQAQSAHEYVVREGDTLSAIAKRVFGDERQWVVIARANAIEDPQALRVGQRLTIPARAPEGERADPGEKVLE
jgi:nucleoid-associated protein YgaU